MWWNEGINQVAIFINNGVIKISKIIKSLLKGWIEKILYTVRTVCRYMHIYNM